tara:strand:+ start:25559 stop:25951 length:393 start_codon:yes stop_codon:yes gene_type:complete
MSTLGSDFIPMIHHNKRYLINPQGLVFDTRKDEFIQAKMYSHKKYPSVSLRSWKAMGKSTIYEIPRLIYLYFVSADANAKVSVTLKDETLPISVENLNVHEFRTKSRKQKSHYQSVDQEFHNWNDTALYC